MSRINWRKVATFVTNNHKWIAWIGFVIASLATTYLGCKPLPKILPLPDSPLVFERSFGWIEDKDLIAKAFADGRFPDFATTPAGRAAMAADKPVALWKAVEKAWAAYRGPAKDDRPYPAENQQDVGCCVGCGTKHVADASYAVEVFEGMELEEWHPLSIEAIYAAGRVDIGGGNIRGDGSLGGYSAAASTRIGFAPMMKIGNDDLSKFNRYRAREWGRTGMPAAVKEVANAHRMGSAARIKSWEECKKALIQGYGIFLCSSVGFEGKKDADGFIKPSGRWDHCMALLGFRLDREGGLILNSWGPEMHRGPAGWNDPPAGSFWADAKTIDRMCASGDCYALSSLQGFPARKLNFWIKAEPKPRNKAENLFASFSMFTAP